MKNLGILPEDGPKATVRPYVCLVSLPVAV